MKLYFHGHEEKYAVEQTMLTLFPRERPEYPAAPPAGDNSLELSLSTGDAGFTAEALLRRDGITVFRRCQVPRPAAPLDQVGETRLRRRALQSAFYQAATALLEWEPPWGMLSGVRPVKLPVRAILGGAAPDEAEVELETLYRVSPLRRALAMDCARASLGTLASLAPNEISLYLGIPFCPTRCAYCSFVSATGGGIKQIPAYLDTLFGEIAAAGAAVREQGLVIRSAYLGGGTPTTLSAEQLKALLSALRSAFPMADGAELTVEAGRPDTITREKLEAIRRGGGNRVSLNPQTMSDAVLAAIGRAHSAQDIRSAWPLVREQGFHAVNMDLIAGLPSDTLEGFRASLFEVLALAPENITVHTLALKKGSALIGFSEALADGGLVAGMLDLAWEALRGAGYLPYYLYRQKFMSGAFENVGWCKPGYESVYNICMMEELHSVLSLGAGGVTKSIRHGKGTVRRFSNPKYPQEYIRDGARIISEKRQFAP